MLAALVRILGLHNFDLAEDVVQDTLVRALETWRYGRLPDNPAAWLMRTARNGALDVVRRERSSAAVRARSQLPARQRVDARADPGRAVPRLGDPRRPAADDVLLLPPAAGAGGAGGADPEAPLRLRHGEIARAFLTENATIEKRIARGKQALRESGTLYEIRSRCGHPRAARRGARRRSTSSSTRATTAATPSCPSGRSSAPRPCGSSRCSWSTRGCPAARPRAAGPHVLPRRPPAGAAR
jgi:predicted RNA polymerase sigma factor